MCNFQIVLWQQIPNKILISYSKVFIKSQILATPEVLQDTVKTCLTWLVTKFEHIRTKKEVSTKEYYV